MFCPECGLKLLYLAKGYGKVEPTETENQKLRYYVCGSCKRLLQKYGKSGYHFNILGTITDEALAVIIADSIKGGT